MKLKSGVGGLERIEIKGAGEIGGGGFVCVRGGEFFSPTPPPTYI